MVGGRGRDRTGDPLLAKQVLSQLSYTPTVGVTFILKHFRRFQNSFLRVFWSDGMNPQIEPLSGCAFLDGNQVTAMLESAAP